MRKDLYSILAGSILGIGILYFGWCWGLWGRNNIWMRHVFQCSCPRVSEKARYKPFKVIASACIDPSFLDLSPSSNYMLIAEKADKPKIIRLDLQNGKTKVVGSGKGVAFFLTDDLLLFVSYDYQAYYLVDVSDGFGVELYPESDMEKAVTRTKSMDRVWVEFLGMVVGLKDDYKTNPEGRIFYLATRAILDAHGIELDPEPFFRASDYGLRAEMDGIYLDDRLIVRSGQVPNESDWGPNDFIPNRWVLDGNAVTYEAGDHNISLSGKPTKILQPILLLEIPPESKITNKVTP